MKGKKPYERVPDSPFKLMDVMVNKKEPPELEHNLRQPLDLWDLLQHCWHFEASNRVTAKECQTYWRRLVSALIVSWNALLKK